MRINRNNNKKQLNNNSVDLNNIYNSNNKNYSTKHGNNNSFTNDNKKFVKDKKNKFFDRFYFSYKGSSNLSLTDVKLKLLNEYKNSNFIIYNFIKIICWHPLMLELFLFWKIQLFFFSFLIFIYFIYLFLLDFTFFENFIEFWYRLYAYSYLNKYSSYSSAENVMNLLSMNPFILLNINYIYDNYLYFFWIEIFLTIIYLFILILLIAYFSFLTNYNLIHWLNYKIYYYFYWLIIFFVLLVIFVNFFFILPNVMPFFEQLNYHFLISPSGDFFFSSLNIFIKSFILFTFIWWLWTVIFFLKYNSSIYYSLFLVTLTFISVIVSLIMVSSCNLIIIYITMEIQSLCFYVLAAWNDKFEIKGTEASLKYLFLGGVASNLFLFGSGLIYFSFDSVHFFDIIKLLSISNFSSEPIAYIGFCFLTFGLLFKLAIVPFHFWIADVYEGSNWLIVSFFAIMPKLPYIFLLLQLWLQVFYVFHYIFFFKELWIFLGVISILYGSSFMLYASHLGRIAAYSSIINVGFIFLAISCSWNINAIIFYIISYILQLFLFFVVVIYSKIYYLHDLLDMFHKNSFLAIAFTISLFSLMGIPPFAGFCAKFILIHSFILHSDYFVAFIFVLLSVFSAVPYLRLIRMIFNFVNKRSLKRLNYNVTFTYLDMVWLTSLLLFNVFFFLFVDYFLILISLLTSYV